MNWVGQAYASLAEKFGKEHTLTKRASKYLHFLVGSMWARKKIYEDGIGNEFPDSPLEKEERQD